MCQRVLLSNVRTDSPTVSFLLFVYCIITGKYPKKYCPIAVCGDFFLTPIIMISNICEKKMCFFAEKSQNILSVQKKILLSHSNWKTDIGAIAQLVEQRTENPCVPSSILGGTTKRGCVLRPLSFSYMLLLFLGRCLSICFTPLSAYSDFLIKITFC